MSPTYSKTLASIQQLYRFSHFWKKCCNSSYMFKNSCISNWSSTMESMHHIGVSFWMSMGSSQCVLFYCSYKEARNVYVCFHGAKHSGHTSGEFRTEHQHFSWSAWHSVQYCLEEQGLCHWKFVMSLLPNLVKPNIDLI